MILTTLAIIKEQINPDKVLLGLILGHSFGPFIILPNIKAEVSVAQTIAKSQ